jgi:hypothetical protein
VVSKELIAKKNDEIRSRLPHMEGPGKLYLTPAVDGLSQERLLQLFEKIKHFKDFTPDNDPYGEHDAGVVFVEGDEYYWKFDYVNGDDMESYKEDGVRILTIMRLSEY